MAGIPVKLTFDPSYPDHTRALELLRAQKHTTQFVVNLIIGAVSTNEQLPHQEQSTGNRQVTQVTERLPLNTISGPQTNPLSNLSNPRVTPVTTELPTTAKTSLEDIPSALLGFIEGD